ncbi:MAG TPA: hypothetical protein PK246_04710 [Saprospiraceae bacterium]|nr:hypothetical protein [Saprospiraceae bacterium]
MTLVCLFYYPKWEKNGMSGVITYDIAGYYMYLPATFIYHDLKYFSFEDSLKKPPINIETNMGRVQENGSYVIQYTCGMALQYLPFFAVANAWAKASPTYKTNGFSLPYQFMLYFGSLLIAFIGLYYLRKVLLLYFSDTITTLVLISLGIGTNYLVYATINGPMTHNYLFTNYCILIWLAIKYFKTPRYRYLIPMAILVGLAILTRPTEALVLLPIMFWGIQGTFIEGIKNRLQFFTHHKVHLLFFFAILFVINSIQLFYWKYLTGNWFVYSYGDQGFDWLSPYVYKGLFSTQVGWLVYSPIMIFSLIGFRPFIKQDRAMGMLLLTYILLFMYVCFSWKIWWYGGSLGQRAMIQSYPFLAFPMAYFYQSLLKRSWISKTIVTGLIMVMLYLSLWYAHMAHRGGMLVPPTVTTAYLTKLIGRWHREKNDLKLLETNEEFLDKPYNAELLCNQFYDPPVEINSNIHLFEAATIDTFITDKKWLRFGAKLFAKDKEWTNWKETQMIVNFTDNDRSVKSRFIRVHKLMDFGIDNEIFIDVKFPNKKYDKIHLQFLQIGDGKPTTIKQVYVYAYNEEN